MSTESEILFELVRGRYGDRLTQEELEEVRKGVERLSEAAQALRKVRLENWDEPFTIFKPYRRGDERGP